MEIQYTILSLSTILLALIYIYFHLSYKYWKNRNFPFLPPKFPLGNGLTFLRKTRAVALETMEYYKAIKERHLKFAGIYFVTRPVLVVIDPDYIKDILARDFDHFVDRGVYYNKNKDPVSAHLFTLNGTDWRKMRVMLTPTFTSGKMKMMFPDIIRISSFMVEAVEKSIANDEDIKAKDVLSRFTCDVIGCCAFGIHCNSFKNPDAEFWQFGVNSFSPKDLKHMLSLMLIVNAPKLAYKLGFKALREDVSEFCLKIVQETLKHRRSNNIQRPDFLQLLMDIEKKGGSITFEEMAAQCFIFFIAGFETSSTTMTFAMYELCRNPEIQEKLRQEINRVLDKYQGELTYDNLKEMTYLQQVLDETLRIYPPLPNLERVCVKDYKLRDTDLVIEKGTQILIPSICVQRDPDYYQNPEKFDPDRWQPEVKQERNRFLFLPFGEGPRNCIGLRFGVMQSKIGLVTLLSKYKWEISSKTEMPLTLDPRKIPIDSSQLLYLKATKI